MTEKFGKPKNYTGDKLTLRAIISAFSFGIGGTILIILFCAVASWILMLLGW